MRTKKPQSEADIAKRFIANKLRGNKAIKEATEGRISTRQLATAKLPDTLDVLRKQPDGTWKKVKTIRIKDVL